MAGEEKPFGLIHELRSVERDLRQTLMTVQAKLDNVRWLISEGDESESMKSAVHDINEVLLLIKKVIG